MNYVSRFLEPTCSTVQLLFFDTKLLPSYEYFMISLQSVMKFNTKGASTVTLLPSGRYFFSG